MSDFEFTDVWEDGEHFDSSAVEYVWYNENTKQVAVEWYDSTDLYVYSGVERGTVESVVGADSVGAAVTSLIKQPYGPGENRGNRYDVGVKAVDVRAQNATKEFSLQPPAVTNVVNTPGPVDATKEFSLQTPPAPVQGESKVGGLNVVDGSPVFTLHFDHDGAERTYTVRAADNWEAAVERLDEFASAVGLDITVNKVVVTFE